MARLPNLVAAIGNHDRRGKPTIAHIARLVRDNELIASRTRGVGAAVMTMTDATTLLLGVIGDSSPGGALAAIANLKALRPLPWDKIDEMQREDLPEVLQFLRPRRGFAETLEQLLVHAPQLAEWARGFSPDAAEQVLHSQSSQEVSILRGANKFRAAGVSVLPPYEKPIRIVSYVPGLAAEIHLGMPWDQDHNDGYHEYFCHPDVWSNGDAVTDCLCTMEIGLPILLALHKAVVGD